MTSKIAENTEICSETENFYPLFYDVSVVEGEHLIFYVWFYQEAVPSVAEEQQRRRWARVRVSASSAVAGALAVGAASLLRDQLEIGHEG